MTLPARLPRTCDIFCRVVDNYGDIGIAWRLARQLVAERRLTVRLIVDALDTFQKLVPALASDEPEQAVDGVAVIAWSEPFPIARVSDPAELVIEAFGCELPMAYLRAMAERRAAPVWINLEYLSAENWVERHHLLPSPHPSLPLTKYFFFPGFTIGTGGLLRERGLIAQRDACDRSDSHDRLQVLIFAYECAPAEALFTAVSETGQPTVCRVAEGHLEAKLQHWRGQQAEKGLGGAPMLEFEVLPFVPQAEFDQLLWTSDILFVRGEDSFVRAQWAARPFVWHVYPQAENAHLRKLAAFLDLYCDGLSVAATAAIRDLWGAWNRPQCERIAPAWAAFLTHRSELIIHARRWSGKLSAMPDLASNVLSFFGKNAKL